MVTAPVIRLGPPLSVSVRAPALKVLELTGSLKVTSTEETGVFRGLGETAAIEVTDSGETIWIVAWAEVGRGLDVAGVVGRHAVEAVGVAGLAGEEWPKDWRA